MGEFETGLEILDFEILIGFVEAREVFLDLPDFDWKIDRMEEDVDEVAKCIGPSGEENDIVRVGCWV